ncbi:MAG TPA: hypothetical protein PLU10_00410 [Chitinophagaceae bacterium]|nr:hypothetical protein [Chitinophagaceae bacterium]
MSQRILHIILYALGGIVLLGIFYVALNRIGQASLEVHISMKSTRTSEMQLFASTDDDLDSTQKEMQRTTVIASQFYKDHVFQFADANKVQELVCFMGIDSNTFFIEHVSVIRTQLNVRDTLLNWFPELVSLPRLFKSFHDVNVVTQSPSYLELHTLSNTGFARMNEATFFQKDRGKSLLQFGKLRFGIIAFVFTLFILFSIRMAPVGMKAMQFEIPLNRKEGLIYFFFGFVLIACVNSFVGWIPDRKNAENRLLSSFPKISWNSFLQYPEQLNAYIEEHYSFRNTFFFLNSLLHTKVLKASALPEKVILGDRYWFYYNELNTLNDFRRLTTIDTTEMMNVVRVLHSRMKWLEKRNIRYYILVPPNKERIYPEFMPSAYYAVNGVGHNRLDFYKKILAQSSPVQIIDPTDSLYVAKLKKDVYYTTDTHWNLYGGFKGYQCLMTAIQKDFPELTMMREEDFKISEQFIEEGDLASMLALNSIYKRKEYSFTFKDSTKELGHLSSSDIILRFDNPKVLDSSNLKLVMFRDSYANYLIPFLNMHFKKAVYVWNYEFMNQLVEEEKPNIVVFESLERFLSYSLSMPNPPAVDAELTQK